LQAINGIPARIELAGFSPDFDWSVRNVQIVEGLPTGVVFRGNSQVGLLRLSVAGEYNLLNAAMAVAAISAYGISPESAIEALNRFTGVDRRMSIIGHCNGALIVDDYGHHPTEIRVTLAALRQRYMPRRLICVFQPHQHSRTRFLLNDFAASFALADQTIVPEIYFVRDSEAERQSVCAQDLVQRINEHGQLARYIPDFAEIADYLRKTLAEDDLLVTMGAGNVWEIGRKLVEQS
jgi:UDP-N-acetylmuramate--alanine ligase